MIEKGIQDIFISIQEMNQVPCRNTQYMQNVCRQPGVSCQYRSRSVQTTQCGNATGFVETVQVNLPPVRDPQCQRTETVGRRRTQ